MKIKSFLSLTLDEYALLLIGMARPYAGKFGQHCEVFYIKFTLIVKLMKSKIFCCSWYKTFKGLISNCGHISK
jgi:hypothetical protein